MHTHETEREAPGVGPAAKNVAEHASSLVRLELELAALEVRRKLISLAKGIAFAFVAAILLVYAIGFGLGSAAAGIATFTSVWVALLIVTGGLVLLTALFGALAALAIKRGAPPVPEQALREAKLTSEALKSNGNVE